MDWLWPTVFSLFTILKNLSDWRCTERNEDEFSASVRASEMIATVIRQLIFSSKRTFVFLILLFLFPLFDVSSASTLPTFWPGNWTTIGRTQIQTNAQSIIISGG